MGLKDGLRDLLDGAEHSAARWLLVAVGVVVLLRLKLILFAAALPVMAYWHYSNQLEPAEAEADGDAGDADADMDSAWPPEDEEDADNDGLFQADTDCGTGFGIGKEEDGDPYDQSFWGQEDEPGEQKRSAPWRSTARNAPPKAPGTLPNRRPDGNDDMLGSIDLDDEPAAAPGHALPKHLGDSWDTGGAGDTTSTSETRTPGSGGRGRGRPISSFAGLGGGEPDLLGGFGSLGADLGGSGVGDPGGGGGGGGLMDDFDLPGLGGDDMDFLGGCSGRGKGKGKGKSKFGDKGGKDSGPREPNPKQVFVANVGDMPEEEIRSFFEEVGEVDRLKVLRTPEGASKGVCFVTFRTEEQAQKALALHGTMLEGKNLVVRLAHGGNKGGEKGGKGSGGMDRMGGMNDGPLDLGGSERFGAAFGFDRGDRDRAGSGGFGKGGRGGKGGGRRTDRGEMDDLLEEVLADSDGPIKPADFDFAARRFLTELRLRDRSDGTTRFQEAMDMVLKYTSSKDRSSVRKWPAYIFTLLQKFDQNLWEELRERDAERRREKGGGGFGGKDR